MEENPPDAPIQRPLTFFSAAIWTLIAAMLTTVCVQLTEQSREGAIVDVVSVTACLALSYSLVLFGVLRLHEPQTDIRHILAVRAPSALVIVASMALGAALSFPSEWIDTALESRFPVSAEDSEAVQTLLNVSTVGKRIALFTTLVLLRPILTELFFRGVLFTPLRRGRKAETVILAVAAFEALGSLSVSPRELIALLAATLVFSWLRGVTGSIVPAILAHVAFTAPGVIPICLGKSDIVITRQILIASGITSVLALFAISYLARGARAVEARRQDAGEVPL